MMNQFFHPEAHLFPGVSKAFQTVDGISQGVRA